MGPHLVWTLFWKPAPARRNLWRRPCPPTKMIPRWREWKQAQMMRRRAAQSVSAGTSLDKNRGRSTGRAVRNVVNGTTATASREWWKTIDKEAVVEDFCDCSWTLKPEMEAGYPAEMWVLAQCTFLCYPLRVSTIFHLAVKWVSFCQADCLRLLKTGNLIIQATSEGYYGTNNVTLL